MPNHFNETVLSCERRDLLCSYSNGDIFTCENNMLSSRVKISCFRGKAHLVFHWCLYNKMFYYSLLKHWIKGRIKVCGPFRKPTSDWFQTFTAVLDNTRRAMSKTSLNFGFSATSIKAWRLGAFWADLLGNRRLLQRVQKVMIRDLWLVDFDSFCVFLSVSRLGCFHV